jgi:excisionase family DNA binding protein
MPVIRRSLEPSKSVVPQCDCYKRGYTVREAAKFAGVSVWQVRQWIQSGELKPAMIGNKHILDKAALDRLLDGLFKV